MSTCKRMRSAKGLALDEVVQSKLAKHQRSKSEKDKPKVNQRIAFDDEQKDEGKTSKVITNRL